MTTADMFDPAPVPLTPYIDMEKIKERLVADGSQQARNLCDFVSSATISLQVFNIATYYRCILSTVDIRGPFLTLKLSQLTFLNK